MTAQPTKKDIDVLAEYMRTRQEAAKAHALIFPKPPKGHLPVDDFWPSPLMTREAKSGRVQITHRAHKAGEILPVIGARQALLRGMRPVNLQLYHPITLIHELREERSGVWMTDLPEELHQIAAMLRDVRPEGRVLVGGLGLGLVVHFLLRRPMVEKITVVERSPDVIKLIKPTLPLGADLKVEVVKGDIKKFLQSHSRPFDYYLLDTWQGTSESTWWTEVMPLKRIIRRKWDVKPTVHCWAEDIMAGQILEKLASDRRNWYYEKLPPEMPVDEAAQFVANVGTKAWEKSYGRKVPRP